MVTFTSSGRAVYGAEVTITSAPARVVAAGLPASVLMTILAPEKLIGWNRTPLPEDLPANFSSERWAARPIEDPVTPMTDEAAVPLFSYDTRRQKNVLMASFGRLLAGSPDALPHYASAVIENRSPSIRRGGSTSRIVPTS